MSLWPELNYQEWKDTCETLHRYLQVVGKLRIYKAPWLNHSWHATYYVTSRGLTTSAIPLDDRNLTVNFDFIDHTVLFQDSLGKEQTIKLQDESVAEFFQRFQEVLKLMGISGYYDYHPVECADNTPFNEDHKRKTYDPSQVANFFQALVRVTNVFQKFRAEFIGKSSPVHLFWGSFDLVVTRFSGRKAPEHPGAAPYISPLVVKEAYSHEVCSFGFWPGNELYPLAAFYSYSYPEPNGYKTAKFGPQGTYYNKDLGEFILHYDEVRRSEDPEGMLLGFLEGAYKTATSLGNWDAKEMEETTFMGILSERYYENRPEH